MGLTDCKTADRITVQIQVCNPFGMLYSDIRVNCTLVNAEQKLLLIDRIVQADVYKRQVPDCSIAG